LRVDISLSFRHFLCPPVFPDRACPKIAVMMIFMELRLSRESQSRLVCFCLTDYHNLASC
jgi:hypothetical protein